MTEPTDPRPILVLGATGLQGGAVAQALLAAGLPVRALVREAAKGQTLVALGATLVIGDFEDPASLVAACHGVRAVFSVQNAPLFDADSERREGRNIITAAREVGVPQFIHTSVSGTGAWHRSVVDWGTGRWNENYWESKADVENLVRDAGFASYTILKPAFMMENFTRPKADFMFPDLIDDALVTAMLPATKLAVVSAIDIGRMTTAAVRDPELYNGRNIELAGDAVTLGEIAAALSAATGRRITATSLPVAEVIARGQFPGWVSSQEWYNYGGYPATPADAERYGLTLLTFAAWAAQHAADIAAT